MPNLMNYCEKWQGGSFLHGAPAGDFVTNPNIDTPHELDF